MRRYLLTGVAALLLAGCDPATGQFHIRTGQEYVQMKLQQERQLKEAIKLRDERREQAWNEHAEQEYQRAEREHICTGYNPSGCLSPAQRQGLVTQATDAAACYNGDLHACNRYPGGAPAATSMIRNMWWQSCVTALNTGVGISLACGEATKQTP